MVKYVPLAIQDPESLAHILGLADKANGYVFARLAEDSPVPPEMMYGASVKVSSWPCCISWGPCASRVPHYAAMALANRYCNYNDSGDPFDCDGLIFCIRDNSGDRG